MSTLLTVGFIKIIHVKRAIRSNKFELLDSGDDRLKSLKQVFPVPIITLINP